MSERMIIVEGLGTKDRPYVVDGHVQPVVETAESIVNDWEPPTELLARVESALANAGRGRARRGVTNALGDGV